MKQKFYLAFALLCFFGKIKAQSITFNYATSGLSTTDCNIFNPPVAVQGYTHTSVTSIPQFTGAKILLPVAYSTVANTYFGTAYAISYTFTSGHGYAVKANVDLTTNNASAPKPKFYFGLSSSLPSTSNLCGGWVAGYTNSPFSNFYNASLNASNNIIQAPYVTGSGQTYLLLGAYPSGVGSSSFSDFSYVNSISIIDVPPIVGASLVCYSTPQNYSVNTTYPVTWQATPTGIVSIVASGTYHQNAAVSYSSGGGNVTLSATVATPNGNVVVSKQIFVGSPNFPGVTNIQQLPAPYNGISGTAVTPEAAPYYWYIDGVLKKTTTDKFSDIVAAGQCGVQHYFQVGVVNSCTTTPIKSVPYFFTNSCTSFAFVASPNPSSGRVHIGIANDAVNQSEIKSFTPGTANDVVNQRKIKTFDVVRIYNIYGKVVKEMRYSKTSSADLNLNLPNGNYFIEIQDGKYSEKQHLLINK